MKTLIETQFLALESFYESLFKRKFLDINIYWGDNYIDCYNFC